MNCLLLLLLALADSFADNHRLGESLLQQNKLTEAIPHLEKAYALNPADYVNAYDLALSYLQVKSLEKSRRVVNDLIKRADKAELHNLLGDIEEADGHTTEAAQQYELAARMEPSEKNLFDLGSDLLNHRGFDPALKVFDFAVQHYPQSAKLRVGLGVSYYSLGRYDDAVKTLCDAVDLDPDDTKALDFLGKMYDISPQYAEQVTKRLAGFVQRYPKNASAAYYYALSLRKKTSTPSAENDHAAEPYLLRAVELQPNFSDAHYELGLLYQDLGQDAKATRELELSVKQRPNSLKAHYHLARLYQRNGRADLARQEFSRIEELKSHAQ